MERIHTANLINFGIIPLFFENPADYQKIEENDSVLIENTALQLHSGNIITAKLIKQGGNIDTLKLKHNLNKEDVEIIIAGGILNRK